MSRGSEETHPRRSLTAESAREPQEYGGGGGGHRPRDPDRRRPDDRVVRIDTHVHTSASYDSTADLRAVLARAERIGLDGLIVTDHDRIESALRARRIAPEYGLVAVPGVEVSTADGHLLALGVDVAPEPGCSLPATLAEIRRFGGLGVVPHPFQLSRHGASASAITDCDGVEVYNAYSITGIRNGQAGAFAESEGYPEFGGSDAHRPRTVGRAYTEVLLADDGRSRSRVADTPPDADTILSAMRAGRTRARGRRTSVRRYLGKYATNVRLRTGSML
jgi:predicted metal-dependent phosphoesterase TrpH